MPHGYGYGNTRLRAMRSRFLTEADYSSLLAKTTVEELITGLTATPYKSDIEAALVRSMDVRCVDEALQTNLTRTLSRLREFYEGQPRGLIDLLLYRWDRHNLLTLLRGQSQHVSPEEILPALVPVGRFDLGALRELARQPNLQAMVDLLATWRLPYAEVLHRVRAHTGDGAVLDQLELALNRSHYASIRAELKPRGRNDRIALDYFQTEIDLVNLGMVLYLAHRPEIIPLLQRRYQVDDIRSFLVEPGGHLPPRQLADLFAGGGSLEGVVRGLSGTRYRAALEAGWRRYQAGEGDLEVIERELERYQAEEIKAMFGRDPLSLSIPIGYIGCKWLEITNLRLVAQAVALNLKRDEVRRDLIMVY